MGKKIRAVLVLDDDARATAQRNYAAPTGVQNTQLHSALGRHGAAGTILIKKRINTHTLVWPQKLPKHDSTMVLHLNHTI